MAFTWDADTIVSLVCILVLMASLSSALDIDQLKLKLKKPWGILIGLFCQYIILPLTAFLLSISFNFSPSLRVGLIIIATCPGGSLSNFWCFMFNADLPLSIAMTSASSLLSFAFITINGLIYIPIVSKGKINIDYISLIISVSSVIIGIGIGIIIAIKGNKKLLKFMGLLAIISMLTIFIWALIGSTTGDAKIRDLPPTMFIAVVLLNIIGFGLAFALARILKFKRQAIVSIAVEASNQNAPLAYAILLLTLDPGRDRNLATNVPVVYMICNILCVVLVLGILRKTNWLTIDYDDKTMTFGKLIRQKMNNSQNDIDKEKIKENSNEVELDTQKANTVIDNNDDELNNKDSSLDSMP